MKNISSILLSLAILASCTKESKGPELTENLVHGELAVIAKERGLSPNDLLAAVKTYNPSGVSQEYLAFFGTGVAGRIAVVGMPSMKILKYVSVFSAEPWQGYAFDDESKGIIKASARDEIEYSFGDIGLPALSLTKGIHDARAIFMADGANGRLGLIDLSEYEAKQIVTHPLFKNSQPDVSVSENTTYVSQTTAIPEMINGKKSSGVTFWRFLEKTADEHKIYFIDPTTSFTVLLDDVAQSSPAMGRGISEGLMLSVTKGAKPSLNIVDWKAAEKVLATKGQAINHHLTLSKDVAVKEKVLRQVNLPAGSERVIISGDGKKAVVTNKISPSIQLLDLTTIHMPSPIFKTIETGGATVDAAFSRDHLFVTAINPNELIKISDKGSIVSRKKLDFIPGKIMIPGSDTVTPSEDYAVLTNHSASGRFTNVGPQTAISSQLLDIQADEMTTLYDASIPQATRLAAVAMSTKLNKPVYKYKIGTDPRSGLISNYKTPAGQEKIVRHGKRVHVYATLIRSHITPDLIEVEQGDIVSIHLTSNEQSRDQVHGFTIDTYNVHGSWEPGKTATVTFVADRAGVFPFYCTEFCSALHLEMQGYLLVKPSQDKKVAQTDALLKLHHNPTMKNFFNYIQGEK